jgi:benzoylformate decarboxylase
VCFVNHEYRLLKDLWVSFTGGTFDATRFVGLDFDDPALDLDAIMGGFGAVTEHVDSATDMPAVMAAARHRNGPTMLFIDRRP